MASGDKIFIADKATLDQVRTTVTTINTNTAKDSTVAKATALSTLQTTANTINTNTARGAVKSVQRGTYNLNSETSVTISAVNINKSVLITHDKAGGGAASVATLSSSIVIRLQGNLDWQVIEFY